MQNKPSPTANLSITRHSWQFAPKLWSVIATLLGLAIFISLGGWQLHRYEVKQAQKQLFEMQINQAAKPLVTLKDKPLNYLKISWQGQFINQMQLILDNRTQNHRPGYEVITPMRIQGSSRWLLVNRGWVPAGRTRAQLPAIKAVNGLLTLAGRIYYPSKSPYLLAKQSVTKAAWPRRIQAVDLKLLTRTLGHSLYPFVALLGAKQAHGFTRHWLVQTIEPKKHIGYAIQWFLFAAILTGIFIKMNLKRVESNEE